MTPDQVVKNATEKLAVAQRDAFTLGALKTLKAAGATDEEAMGIIKRAYAPPVKAIEAGGKGLGKLLEPLAGAGVGAGIGGAAGAMLPAGKNKDGTKSRLRGILAGILAGGAAGAAGQHLPGNI
jgi:hypothetical protein